MGKLVGAVALSVLFVVLSVTVLVSAVSGGAPPAPGPSGSGSGAAPSGVDRSPALPAGWAQMDQAAAATCPGLPWTVLAAIGTVESGSGRSTAPGVASGANAAGAEGPMQFEPATFAAYATVGPGGARPPDPYDPVDAVYTAATLLCADGGGGPAAGLRAAVFAYNHDDAYVNTVLTLALAFGDDPGVDGAVVAELQFAADQIGTPYRWGGTGAGGFDCSGLSPGRTGPCRRPDPACGPGPVRRRSPAGRRGHRPPGRPGLLRVGSTVPSTTSGSTSEPG